MLTHQRIPSHRSCKETKLWVEESTGRFLGAVFGGAAADAACRVLDGRVPHTDLQPPGPAAQGA